MINLRINDREYLQTEFKIAFEKIANVDILDDHDMSLMQFFTTINMQRCRRLYGYQSVKPFIFDKYVLIIKFGEYDEIHAKISKGENEDVYSISVVDMELNKQTHIIRWVVDLKDPELKVAVNNEGYFLKMKEFSHMQREEASEYIVTGFTRFIYVIEEDIMLKLSNKKVNTIINEDSIRQEHTPTSSSNKKKKSKKSTDTILDLNDVIKLVNHKDGEKREYNRTCECWDVRGYYRHLKNGKTIFVKGFQKGKKRNTKVDDKTYNLKGI